jgi:antirestriction protein ArdC
MSLYTKVTAQILSALQHNTVPWIRPWSTTAGRNIPRNAVSDRPYSGVNTVLLWQATSLGYTQPRFMTFAQVKRVGATLKKGTHGFKIYFVKKMEKKDDEDSPKHFTMLREYTVFNIDQVTDLPDNIRNPEPPPIKTHAQRHDLADSFLGYTGAVIREGPDRAYYSPSADQITLPHFDQFSSGDAFYNTAFHELGHWTGHPSRLARDLKNRFGTRAYAAEELVAELTAAFLCAEFSFDTTTQNTSYIASWIELLQEDNRAFFTAASKAKQAADYLRQLSLRDTQWPSTSQIPNTVSPSTPRPVLMKS